MEIAATTSNTTNAMTDTATGGDISGSNINNDIQNSKWIRKYSLPPAPPGSALVVSADDQKKLYWDRSHYNSKGAQIRALHNSSTLYVGNLAFTTRTRHIHQHFSFLGPVKKVQMGLDRMKKTPCGFCFVEYEERRHALAAVAHLSGTKLDGSVIRVELDAGFQSGRQYGRGVSGGQVRHERKEQRKRSRFGSEDGGANSGGASGERRGSEDAGKQEGYYGSDRGDPDDSMEPSAKRQRI